MSRGFKWLFMDVCVLFQIRIKPTMSQNDDIYQKNSKQSKGQGTEISQSWLRRWCFISLLLALRSVRWKIPLFFLIPNHIVDGFGFRRKTQRKEPPRVPLKPEKKREVNSFIKTTCKWRSSQEAAAPGGTRLPAGAVVFPHRSLLEAQHLLLWAKEEQIGKF